MIKNKKRCPWVPENDSLYTAYHDTEWGVVVHDDNKIFEYLILESAQAGLSWRIVLHKRYNYKKAFANFNPKKVAKFTDGDVAKLLMNAGIIRNRQKIIATINNAQKFLEIQKEFGSFSSYIWKFVKDKPILHELRQLADYPKDIPEAVILASDLKKRGFKFLGPTVIYAHMQATGMVNDHTIDCFRHKEVSSQHKKR
ncbi:MAG: DNA-3-methyladenine glycosylase I [Candidatus Vogelbacteria bacterium]|nr:DNA-3-methyladenine glycosylase I [Candidatus Vogelbacteria bacterium]